jgi:CubicO group peptidase (beta-lactamase class C family)
VTTLQELLDEAVAEGLAPGAAALVDRGAGVEVSATGEVAVDSIVRTASISKPVTAAAVMLLVEDGVLTPADPIDRWLPELAAPVVVRTPQSPLDDVVAAARPITVEDILTFRAGWGFPADFSLPAVAELLERVPPFGVRETPDEWLRTLAGVPMVCQPGDAYLYNTCSDIQGVLIARASGRSLPEFMAERIFEPLGMTDTGFHVPADRVARIPPYHAPDGTPIGDDVLRSPPIFPSGAGGLVSTLADLHRFNRMLLDTGGELLSPESLRLMMTNHLTHEQREAAVVFLDDAGWGFGGSVAADGRYGWVGGTGTSAHVRPRDRIVGILLTQVQMASPAAPPIMRRFWRYAFGAA